MHKDEGLESLKKGGVKAKALGAIHYPMNGMPSAAKSNNYPKIPGEDAIHRAMGGDCTVTHMNSVKHMAAGGVGKVRKGAY